MLDTAFLGGMLINREHGSAAGKVEKDSPYLRELL